MSELPARVIKGYRTNARGRKIPIYTEESVTARKEAIALETQKADETRPVNTVRIKKSGRNTLYQRWDGTQWLTATGNDISKYRSLYNNQQELAEQLENSKPPSGYNATEDKESQEINKPIDTLPTGVAASKFEGKSTNNLRYPLASMGANQDYIQFGVIEYRRQGLTGGPVGTNQTFEENQLAKRILGTVTLPIPSTIGDNNVQNYGPGTLNFLQEQGIGIADAGIEGDLKRATTEAQNMLNSLVSESGRGLAKSFFASQAVGAFGGNIDLNQLLARDRGIIINPNMELLFTGPGLRNFTFQFKMTPRSAVEGEAIRQIIRVFKRHSAPKGRGGNFLKTPDIFQIRYLTGQKNHPFLNRFKLCALTNMQVNYTGDGVYATYDNGTPVSMIMTLNFQELTPVYAEDYKDTEGVGY